MASASLNGVGVRGLLSNERLIFGVLRVLLASILGVVASILGVFRQSLANTGVEVRDGRDEHGVDVQTALTPLAVIGLLKN